MNQNEETKEKNRIQEYWKEHPVRGSFESYPEMLRAADRLDPFVKRYVDAIDVSGKRVLDLGCGQGVWSYYLAGRGAAGVDALDIVPEVLENNRRLAAAEGLGDELRFHCYDGLTLPFADDSFDVVFSLGVIHHAVDDQALVAEAMRVLKPGGEFTGAVYRKHSPGHYIRLAMRRMTFLKRYIPSEKGTFLAEILECPVARHYTKRSWGAILDAAGAGSARQWSEYCGLERWLPGLGRAVDRATLGRLGYYLLWSAAKADEPRPTNG